MDQFQSGRVGRVLRAVVIGSALAGGGFVLAPAAAAQDGAEVAPFEARWFIVSEGEGVLMRCDASSEWYAIADIPVGTPLYAVGEELGWLEVRYPGTTYAVVPTREGELTPDRASVELSRRSGLRAWSIETETIEGMYKRVFPRAPLAPGTMLEYSGEVRDLSGNVAGWRVIAPAGATGYVPLNALREATPDEAARAEELARGGDDDEAGDEPAADEPTAEEPAEEPATPVEEPAGADGDGDGGGGADDADAAGDDAASEDDGDAGEDGVGSIEMGDGDGPVARDDRGDEADAAAPTPVDALDAVFLRIEQLEAAMESVAEQDTRDAELDAIVTEWRALAGFADEVLSSGMAAQVEAFADRQIALLQVRLEVQRALLQIDDLDAATDTARERFRDIDGAVEAQAISAVYGVLERSTVYDGERLELRYRLRALDGSGRTIAYVRVGEDEELFEAAEALVGLPVGVAGTIAPGSPAVPVVDAESVRLEGE